MLHCAQVESHLPMPDRSVTTGEIVTTMTTNESDTTKTNIIDITLSNLGTFEYRTDTGLDNSTH